MIRSTALLLAAALALVCGLGAPHAAAQDSPGAWKGRLRTAERAAASSYVGLAQWCERQKLPRTAALMRRRALRFDPENSSARKALGFERNAEGGWDWDGAKREAIRELDERPSGSLVLKLNVRRRGTTKKVRQRFVSLAESATAQAKSATDDALKQAWLENAATAWNLTLRVDPAYQPAHEALGSPQVEGRYVTEYARPFVERRQERLATAERIRLREPATMSIGTDSLVRRAGLWGKAARSSHVVVTADTSVVQPDQVARWVERALADLVENQGFPPECVEMMGFKRIVVVESEEQLRLLMRASSKWKTEAAIEKQLDQFASMYETGGRVITHKDSSAKAIDVAMHYACRSAIHAVRRIVVAGDDDAPDLEPWLMEALVTDVVVRLTGDALSSFTDTRRYADERRDDDGKSRWIGLARDLVEMGIDVPIDRITRMRQNLLGSDETVKAYSFMQYLFERDEMLAQEFVLTALERGSAAAADEVYGVPLHALDDGYQEWILETW